MKKYVLHIRVKFRAFGVTFGTVDRDVPILEAFPLPILPVGIIYNDRGVNVTARWE